MENYILDEIEKLNFANPQVIPEENDYQGIVQDVKKIIEKKTDFSLVEKEPVEFLLDSEEIPEDRFYADINSAHFECFFKKGNADYLVVFFSGARSRSGGAIAPYPTFSSWSWYKDVNASILCIDDPMYSAYPDMIIGLYYGTKTDDFRQDTAVLIKRIAQLLGVENKHIILYGRSGGGSSAVGVSDYIKGSCTCSINGQFNVDKYLFTVKQLAEFPGVDVFNDEDYKRRNDFCGIIKKNPENTYLIITNAFSRTDAERSLPYFKEAFSIDTKLGITSVGNAFFWIYSAWGIADPHNSFDSVSLFKLIFEMIIGISNGMSEKEANFLAMPLNDIWFERYNHLIKRKQYENKISELNTELSASKKEIKTLKKQVSVLNESFGNRLLRASKRLLNKIRHKKKV